ncbi:MAG: N-6 DNA methylase, partial [Bacteroidetes bacterium]|nr:N-6 DNA methylase [Bacteroidota bacterium]
MKKFEDIAATQEFIQLEKRIFENLYNSGLNGEKQTFVLYLLYLHNYCKLNFADNPKGRILNALLFRDMHDENRELLVERPVHGLFEDYDGLDEMNDFFRQDFIELGSQESAILEFLEISKAISEIIGLIDPSQYGDLFDHILFHIYNKNGRGIGLNIQPKEVTELMIQLADLKPNAKVYNPFAGYASLCVNLPKDCTFIAQENNIRTHYVAKMRLDAHNLSKNGSLRQEDSIKKWNSINEKFDLIISNPPFGNLAPKNSLNYKTFHQFLIVNGLQNLKPDGKLITLVPQSFLYNSSKKETELRRYCIDNDLVETILALPQGMLKDTGIKTALLILNNKKEKGKINKISLVDAEEILVKKNVREKILDIEKLNSALEKHKDSESVKIVTNEQVKSKDYLLDVQRYFIDYLNNEELRDAIPLKDLLQIVKPIRVKKESLAGKSIQIKNLKNDKLDFQLNLNEIETTEIPNQIYKVEESCLLMATVWNNAKPTYFKYEGEPIYV